MGKGKKIGTTVRHVKIRLFESDVAFLEEVFPTVGVAEVIRTITANYCQKLRQRLEKETKTLGNDTFRALREEPDGADPGAEGSDSLSPPGASGALAD